MPPRPPPALEAKTDRSFHSSSCRFSSEVFRYHRSQAFCPEPPMMSLVWLTAFTGAVLYLAYQRLSLARATFVIALLLLAYTFWGAAGTAWTTVLWVLYAPLALLNITPLRLAFLTRPFLLVYRRMLPRMSST